MSNFGRKGLSKIVKTNGNVEQQTELSETGLSHKNKFSGNLPLKNKLTAINGMQGIKIEKKLKKSITERSEKLHN